MAECLFCDSRVDDMGLGWYRHVEADNVCNDLWGNWMERIKQDHPEG